ncbi:hypothetical protein NIES4073_20630 [Kalymmatonema gypsitolerans NIES-4073]|nr:hypothetical protein NIES4073_20630 [Scytonema sp. NIES-4073]
MSVEEEMASSMNQNIESEDLHQKLREMVAAACEHPPGSLKRQQLLNQLVYQMQQSGRIWRGWGSVSDEDYEDALQQTWLWFCQNLSQYNSEKGGVINWFNIHLKGRLLDIHRRIAQQQATRVTYFDQELDFIDNLPALGKAQPILEETLEWIKTQGTLRSLHLCSCPQINCQVLLLRRLPPEEKTWHEIAREFGVAAVTLSSFYRRKCFPCLLAFGRLQAYIDT